VRIIKEKFLRDAAVQYPKAARYLAAWVRTVRVANWRSLTVGSGKNVIVFNVCGNTYRLIVAIHFDRQTAYTLRFLTHADYSKDNWKNEL
jgi:mRNA interferase HigB